MRNYYIIRTDEHREEGGYIPPVRDAAQQRFNVWSPRYEQLRDIDLSTFNGDYPIYGVDAESHADALAKYLAERKPGSSWIVVKSTNSFRCIPGPVQKSQFTPAGLVPARA